MSRAARFDLGISATLAVHSNPLLAMLNFRIVPGEPWAPVVPLDAPPKPVPGAPPAPAATEINGELGSAYWYTSTIDRKSTRLNSSHTVISYAVFCLKKKKY